MLAKSAAAFGDLLRMRAHTSGRLIQFESAKVKY